MACGGCGVKYKAAQNVSIIDPGKRSRKGVIKASTLSATQESVPSGSQEEESSTPPLSNNPVDGNAGPSTESK